MRGHCTILFLIPLFFAFAFLFSAPAFAAESRTTLKLVFPFGDNTRTISVCPLPNRVIGGCCSDTNRIFTRDNKKGCCPAGNDIETVAGNQGCCYPVTAPQTRWGQTSSSPCGGYCAGGSAVLSYSTISSCCADCPHTDDVRAFMSGSKVCGTCCSKIPDNCGNAGYRVCEEATGSAYCSVDPTKCQPATDWIVGTSGQGGYSCCASCATNTVRLGNTTETCGVCCTNNKKINLAMAYDYGYGCWMGQTVLVETIGPYPHNYKMNINGTVNDYIQITGGIDFMEPTYGIHDFNYNFTLPANTSAKIYAKDRWAPQGPWPHHFCQGGNWISMYATVTLTCP